MRCGIIRIMLLGKSLGLDTDRALSGDELEKLDPKKCKDIINKVFNYIMYHMMTCDHYRYLCFIGLVLNTRLL